MLPLRLLVLLILSILRSRSDRIPCISQCHYCICDLGAVAISFLRIVCNFTLPSLKGSAIFQWPHHSDTFRPCQQSELVMALASHALCSRAPDQLPWLGRCARSQKGFAPSPSCVKLKQLLAFLQLLAPSQTKRRALMLFKLLSQVFDVLVPLHGFPDLS